MTTARVVRIVAMSDTHTMHDAVPVPDGDVFIHAGDFTDMGSLEDVRAFDAFLARLRHRHKIVIAGNHDFCFERAPERARPLIAHATYLEDEALDVAGLRFYGSPWQPWFNDWAFNLSRGEPLRRRWALIPPGIDVLITHGPPRGHGDLTAHGEMVGCDDLLARVHEVRPRLHVFGHIHEGYGVTRDEHTTYFNASTCTVRYEPVNGPLVFELELDPEPGPKGPKGSLAASGRLPERAPGAAGRRPGSRAIAR
jgi:predicted phosphodiesterase